MQTATHRIPAALDKIPESRRANRTGVADFFGVTTGAVDAWTRSGCPCAIKGSRGVSAVYDLLEVARFRLVPKKKDEENHSGIDPESLPPSERKQWYESEIKRRDLQVRDRDLIPSQELSQTVATAFAAISQGLRSLPDLIERRCGASAEIVEEIERVIDAEMFELAQKLSNFGPVDD